jgi:hypothetical protein
MPRTDHHSPHVYVECDLTDGATLVEWRRDQIAAARRTREEARSARPRRRLLPRLAPMPALRPRFA